MKRFSRWAAACVAAALGAAALWQGLQITHNSLVSHQLTGPLRFALVTDLHSTWYGAGQTDLLASLEREQPDAVLLSGDIVDDERPRDAAEAFLRAAAQKYPIYYVLGNHEFRMDDPDAVKRWARELGVTVLEGTGQTVILNGQPVLICGVDDPACGADFTVQFDTVCRMAQDTDAYTVLLSHRPELTEWYADSPFDLVVSGHAHGGQVRLPLVLPDGLIAPGQGLFPQYTTGLHTLDEDTVLTVSRGLCRNALPRVCNRPELMMLDVTPAPDV